MKLNKIAYMSIGALFAIILSFSIISLADNQDQKTEGKNEQPEVTEEKKGNIEGKISYLDQASGTFMVFDGKQKHDFSLTSETQVMINEVRTDSSQLRLDDDVKIMLNSNGDVRYILINRTVQEPNQPEPEVTTASIPESKPVQAPSTLAVPASNLPAKELELQELKVELHQGAQKIKLEWKEDKAELEWKTGKGEVKLKGSEAQAFLDEWFTSLNLGEGAKEKETIALIAKSFKIDSGKPYTATIEWKRGGQEGKWTVEPKDWAKGKKSKDQSHDDDDDNDNDD
ncbi:hypothetical protein [Ammoniphilus sp. CFH 90114]|uniref:hypothetical protein n=1 Tax=Ammoniphilus sp. CFH 90114 TaxID=2493665 RepID=UPI00100EDDED|nr:hypothetical protein [Ammoniphilus sp. CFH 90114]RXT15236.1 hypothetical protein EIZ39_03225 [Ammoniphilus sp. CFH 90114]